MEREDFLARFAPSEVPPEPPPVPAWEGGADPGTFLAALEEAGAEARSAGPEEWVEAVVEVARSWGVRRAVATAEPFLDPAVVALAGRGVEVARAGKDGLREAGFGADLGLTGARWALASTGTVVLVSGRETPPVVSLLPGAHLAVVRGEDLLPDLAALARTLGREGIPPRAVTLVTGPSRTADIEQTMVVGVHGPARMGAVLVRSPAG